MSELRVEVVGICHLCRFLDRSTEGLGRRCRAFPGGIPLGVRAGDIDHRFPVEGDHGLRFEPLAGEASS